MIANLEVDRRHPFRRLLHSFGYFQLSQISPTRKIGPKKQGWRGHCIEETWVFVDVAEAFLTTSTLEFSFSFSL